MHPISGPPVMPNRITTAEPSVGHASETGLVARNLNCAGKSRCAGCAVVRTNIEVRQHTLEQAGDARPDGMAVIQHNVGMPGTQPGNCSRNSSMVRVEERAAAQGDLRALGRKPGSIKGLSIECRSRTQLSGCLPGIQRGTGRIAIAVDDRARDCSADQGRTHCMSKVVQEIDPPISILAGEPG